MITRWNFLPITLIFSLLRTRPGKEIELEKLRYAVLGIRRLNLTSYLMLHSSRLGEKCSMIIGGMSETSPSREKPEKMPWKGISKTLARSIGLIEILDLKHLNLTESYTVMMALLSIKKIWYLKVVNLVDQIMDKRQRARAIHKHHLHSAKRKKRARLHQTNLIRHDK